MSEKKLELKEKPRQLHARDSAFSDLSKQLKFAREHAALKNSEGVLRIERQFISSETENLARVDRLGMTEKMIARVYVSNVLIEYFIYAEDMCGRYDTYVPVEEFEKYIADSRIRKEVSFLYSHNDYGLTSVIGRAYNFWIDYDFKTSFVLEGEDASISTPALMCSIQVNTNTDTGRLAWELLQSSCVTGAVSIGFMSSNEYDKERRIVAFRNFSLVELSLVTVGRCVDAFILDDPSSISLITETADAGVSDILEMSKGRDFQAAVENAALQIGG